MEAATITTSPDIYVPAGASQIQEELFVRIGIQGAPGTGKSTAASTFPNTVYGNMDNSLHHLSHRKDIIDVKFYDVKFVEEVMKIPRHKSGKVNKRDAVKKWLREEGPKLKPSQTFILDSWTTLQDNFDTITFDESERVMTQGGKIDDFAPWDMKIDYAKEIMTMINSMTCNTIVIFHEAQERNKVTGQLTDKVQPLMQGKFVTKLKIYFPNFFRAIVRAKADPDNREKFALDEKGEKIPVYLWQTKSDDMFDAKCSFSNMPAMIPATYKSFEEYLLAKKVST